MISAVRRRTLSNNSNIDFEKLDEVVMGEIGAKVEPATKVQVPESTCIGKRKTHFNLHFLLPLKGKEGIVLGVEFRNWAFAIIARFHGVVPPTPFEYKNQILVCYQHS